MELKGIIYYIKYFIGFQRIQGISMEIEYFQVISKYCNKLNKFFTDFDKIARNFKIN